MHNLKSQKKKQIINLITEHIIPQEFTDQLLYHKIISFKGFSPICHKEFYRRGYKNQRKKNHHHNSSGKQSDLFYFLSRSEKKQKNVILPKISLNSRNSIPENLKNLIPIKKVLKYIKTVENKIKNKLESLNHFEYLINKGNNKNKYKKKINSYKSCNSQLTTTVQQDGLFIQNRFKTNFKLHKINLSSTKKIDKKIQSKKTTPLQLQKNFNLTNKIIFTQVQNFIQNQNQPTQNHIPKIIKFFKNKKRINDKKNQTFHQTNKQKSLYNNKNEMQIIQIKPWGQGINDENIEDDFITQLQYK